MWNRHPEKCAPLVEAGARQVATPAQLCASADVVMLCLANTEVVREVVFGAEGVAHLANAAKLLVDFSSLEPTATREMAAQLSSQTGMAWVDAPVSGGPAVLPIPDRCRFLRRKIAVGTKRFPRNRSRRPAVPGAAVQTQRAPHRSRRLLRHRPRTLQTPGRCWSADGRSSN